MFAPAGSAQTVEEVGHHDQLGRGHVLFGPLDHEESLAVGRDVPRVAFDVDVRSPEQHPGPAAAQLGLEAQIGDVPLRTPAVDQLATVRAEARLLSALGGDAGAVRG